VATGWTVNRSVKNKAAIWVTAAIDHAAAHSPFPILSIDSDCRSQEDNRAFRDADPASWRRDPVGRRAGGRPAWPSSDKPSTPRREQDEVLSTCRLARSRIDVLVVAEFADPLVAVTIPWRELHRFLGELH
jgi:hypothetical protein